jgi:hypothetical protein
MQNHEAQRHDLSTGDPSWRGWPKLLVAAKGKKMLNMKVLLQIEEASGPEVRGNVARGRAASRGRPSAT